MKTSAVTLFSKITDTHLIKMYGFEGSYSKLRFRVTTNSSVRYPPINKRLLVGSGFGLHNWELPGAFWASCLTQEPSR